MKRIPTLCPACGEQLRIRSLGCPACETAVTGDFALPPLLQLPQAEQEFVLEFVRNSGSLKEMARSMGISYPTVRNRLDDIIARLRTYESHETTR